VRLDRTTARGLRCPACGFRDETRSAFFLAEEEGPLERIALKERGRLRENEASEQPSPAPDGREEDAGAFVR
jgi:hypothetical protein